MEAAGEKDVLERIADALERIADALGSDAPFTIALDETVDVRTVDVVQTERVDK